MNPPTLPMLLLVGLSACAQKEPPKASGTTTTAAEEPLPTVTEEAPRPKVSRAKTPSGAKAAGERSSERNAASPPPPDDPSLRSGNPPLAIGTVQFAERDRDKAPLTPMQQGTSSSDIDVTARIRRAVVTNDSFSFAAKNVTIVTRDGHVTLRGRVKSSEERSALEGIARNVAGNDVDNLLEVKK